MMPQLKDINNLERNNMKTIKTELTKINDELLKFYNRPGMALHFQPTNLKMLKNLKLARLTATNVQSSKRQAPSSKLPGRP